MSESELPATPTSQTPDASGPADPPSPPPSAEAATEGSAEAAPAASGDAKGDQAAPDGAKKKRRRKRKPKAAKAESAPKKKDDGHRTPVDALTEGLRCFCEAILDLRARTGGGRLDDESEQVELTIQVPLKGGSIPQVAEGLHASLRDGFEKRVLQAGLLVPGRAWCFSSESFDSDYSRPEDPRQVLVGYGLEGRPRYADLVTLAIERKHESVEDLLAGREGAVTFVEKGSDVTDGVRPAFDPDAVAYPLVAQAVCGLFESSEEGRRVALTIQVLSQKTSDGSTKLIAHPVSAVDLMDLPSSGIRRILRGFQTKLGQLGQQLDGKKAAGEEVDLVEAVLTELREVMRRFSQEAKNRDRKTSHARERAAEGQRPTQLAFPEARSARDHHIYIDNEERTVVVVGKKGRIHVFTPDGRHVTTVLIPPGSVRQRVKAGRWRQAEPSERGSFRETIANKGDSE